MKAAKSKAKFYCDNCGAEVGRDDEQCPSCGRYFSSVRCPRCGYSGQGDEFKRGCPVCGYSAPKETVSETKENETEGKESVHTPAWLYLLTGVLVLIITVLLLDFLR
jgi:uncharacterized membrane protein YvbJ